MHTSTTTKRMPAIVAGHTDQPIALAPPDSLLTRIRLASGFAIVLAAAGAFLNDLIAFFGNA